MQKISAIVCTYNRCESLRDTLTALKQQHLRNGSSLEILVVDNNSRDLTKKVVSEAAKESGWPIRYVFESRQGKSSALNRGIREAAGEFLVMTDDDMIP